ncbi:putative Fe-S cluster assembly protein SufT [Iamia sp. SCSIO 61187]|uniref:putative Fe-S cluster assembly protein SufT n=1 Tax=Iamia sp. SCSIO 61187 TaxID=2722752 RepID=UPI001C62A8D3|nr:putative Fe-S cluster assembly protein SufT [Iamia sp. SCSIO 61187]QYG91463.1 putative Fe-S cluster assembly protein SufT [Iamia sp. SCSIO 61187]
MAWSPIRLLRDCPATTVPAGQRVLLSEGGEVEVVQRLGGSITVRTELGSLLRIDAVDADAVGLEPPDSDAEPADDEGSFAMDRVLDALGQVYDPEIPVSIVDLGLVYRCEELPGPLGTRRIEIDMSMTAPGCGMGDVLRADAARAVIAMPGVDDVEVTLVWDPPWTIHRMSDAARLQLGML